MRRGRGVSMIYNYIYNCDFLFVCLYCLFVCLFVCLMLLTAQTARPSATILWRLDLVSRLVSEVEDLTNSTVGVGDLKFQLHMI